MTDKIPPEPDDYPITQEEAERRRIAYEARRRAYTDAWHAAPAPQPEAA